MSLTEPGTPLNQSSAPFLVVGVGASAGGVEALQAFCAHVPPDSCCAYVVILHLSPDHNSELAALLQAVTSLPVILVTTQVRVQPDHVYVVPPGQHLTMVDGALRVSPNLVPEERRAPIDLFFRTLADTHGGRGVCVILSGSGSDGSMGLKRVKEGGGAVFVQSPREATFAEMPRAAIATDLVDDVLPVADIPARIIAYRTGIAVIEIPEQPEQRPEEQQQALREVFAQLRTRTGHDFSHYKRPTLLRRIARRITVRNLPDLPAYAAFLHDHPDEVRALLKDLLISVTNFFRDRDAFSALEREVLPRLFAGKQAGDQVRLWVVGCATGEEAYSLAMLCAERTLDVLDAPSVQIFATDIDEAAIAHARAGLYTDTDTADVSPERLRRFFTRDHDRYRVRSELRDMVLFANHNILKDPPFSHVDLVSCRNVLIYLDHTAQERVLETLHFALTPGSFLFLGTAESADGASDLFAPLIREHRLFQRRPSGLRPLPLPEPALALRGDLRRPPAPASLAVLSVDTGEQAHERISFEGLHQRLLEQYAPPSLVVTANFEVVHVSEHAARYLRVPPGVPTTNLLELARPELRSELRTALYQALQRQTNVDARTLPIRIDDRPELVTVRVRPVLRDDDPARGFLLVLFEAGAAPVQAIEEVIHSDEDWTRQLEEEVTRLQLQLRTAAEQYEYQTEELRATNEEQQALVEELRASSEELETSKEELQSINEELRTVNQELKVKIEEATQTSTDLQNLVNSTDIATIFLDRSMSIKRFTPAARALFNLIAADYGRPLSDITHQLADINVLGEAERVLTTLTPVEREVRSVDGQAYVLRVGPYRAGEDRIGGVVLTFFDITERTRVAEALRASEDRFRRAIEAAPIPVIMHAEDGQVLQISRSWTELTGYSLADVQTVDAWLNHAYGDGGHAVRRHMRSLFGGEERTLNVTFDIRIRSGEVRHWSFSASSPGTLRDGRRFVVGMAVDITERIRHERALAEQARLLDLSNDAIIVRDVDNRIQYWNHGATELYGWTREEAIGEDLHSLLQTEFEAPLEQLIATLREHDRMEGEVVQVTRDGRRLTLLCRWALDRDAAGLPGAILTTYNDITERKRAEQALRDSEARFRTLADAVPHVIWANDGTGKAIYFNQRWYDYSGLSYDESVGPGWQAIVHPDDAPASVERWQRALAIGEMFDTEYRLRRANGAYRWHLGRNVPLRDDAGRVTGWFGSATDIEALKQAEAARRESEERFRLLVEGARDYAMFLLDIDHRITFWSAGAERLFGWSEAEAVGQDGSLIFTAEDRAAGVVEGEVGTARETGSAIDRRWHVRKDGERLFLDGVLIRLDDEQGQPRGFAKIGRDATAQRQAEEAVERANVELEQRVQERTAALREEIAQRIRADQARQELQRQLARAQEEERLRLARDLHDQLGQQITGLQLGLKQLEAPAQGTPVAAMLPALQDLAYQLATEAHRLAINLRPTALEDIGLVLALEQLLTSWSRQTGIPVIFHSEGLEQGRLPREVEVALYRVVQEALTNVQKHAEATNVSVVLERHGRQVSAIVEDNGRGYEGDEAPTKSEHVHLGVVGMRERLAQVGGRLEIESSPGSGTTVFARIPLDTHDITS